VSDLAPGVFIQGDTIMGKRVRRKASFERVLMEKIATEEHVLAGLEQDAARATALADAQRVKVTTLKTLSAELATGIRSTFDTIPMAQ
jgi:hypothetical protein